MLLFIPPRRPLLDCLPQTTHKDDDLIVCHKAAAYGNPSLKTSLAVLENVNLITIMMKCQILSQIKSLYPIPAPGLIAFHKTLRVSLSARVFSELERCIYPFSAACLFSVCLCLCPCTAHEAEPWPVCFQNSSFKYSPPLLSTPQTCLDLLWGV